MTGTSESTVRHEWARVLTVVFILFASGTSSGSFQYLQEVEHTCFEYWNCLVLLYGYHSRAWWCFESAERHISEAIAIWYLAFSVDTGTCAASLLTLFRFYFLWFQFFFFFVHTRTSSSSLQFKSNSALLNESFFLSQETNLVVYKTQIPSCNQPQHQFLFFFFSLQVVTASFLLLAFQLGNYFLVFHNLT